MFPHRSVLTCLLLTVGVCLAKNSGKAVDKGTVRSLLVALSAVLGFLVLVFVLFIAKRLFFTKHSTREKGGEEDSLPERSEEPGKQTETKL